MNDDTLILYFYDDGLSDAERRSVRETLSADPQLAARYAELRAQLEALRVQPANPAAPAGAADRWHAALDEAAGNQASRRSNGHHHSVWMFAAAAALVLGIGIGLRMGNAPLEPTASVPPERVAAVPPGANISMAPAPLSRGVAAYMQRSRVELAGLDDADGDERDALLAELVAQNRLFERRATASGATELARVLRAFDQLLAALAEQPVNSTELPARRDQLSFEYAVMLTKLGHAPSDDSQSL